MNANKFIDLNTNKYDLFNYLWLEGYIEMFFGVFLALSFFVIVKMIKVTRKNVCNMNIWCKKI